MTVDYKEKVRQARAQRSRMYGAARRVIALLLLACLVLAALAALNWRKLLSAQQKLRYGMVFEAAGELGHKAVAKIDDADLRRRYVEALVDEGNLGRAFYLSELYATPEPRLDALHELILHSRAAAAEQKVYDIKTDAAYSAAEGKPLSQVLRYLLGYRHGLSGDWASARNELAAIDPKKLPPQLRPYRDYYLARAYRLAGTPEEKQQVTGLLVGIIDAQMEATKSEPTQADVGLLAKARYALLSWQLSPEVDEKKKAAEQFKALEDLALRAPTPAVYWSLQKGYTDLAQLRLREGDYSAEISSAGKAVALQPEEKAAEEPLGLLLDQLRRAVKGEVDLSAENNQKVTWNVIEVYGRRIAEAAVSADRAKEFAGLFKELLKLNPTLRARGQLASGLALLYNKQAQPAPLRELMAAANLAGVPDAELAEVYFQYAQLMEQQEQWNEALSYYKSCSKLTSPRQAQALYRCYSVLKEVQEPLNLDAALGYLEQIVQQHKPDEEGYAKGLEELIPLLIYKGRRPEAQQHIDKVLAYGPAKADNLEIWQSQARLRSVAQFWDAYLKGGHSGGSVTAAAEQPTILWNYYEMSSIDPPRPQAGQSWLDAGAGEELAYEYLAGLGLSDEAEDVHDSAQGRLAPVDLLDFLRLYFSQESAAQASQQYAATDMLEGGRLGAGPALDFVLGQAYPQPFGSDVQAAANATGVDPALIYAVMKKESAFKTDNQSWVGAEGLMQLMPGTVRFLIDARGLPADYFARRTETGFNIRLGAEYLASLAQQLGVSAKSDEGVRAILHCYNGGPANYQKWRGLYSGTDPILFTSLVPNEQNENYAMLVYKYYRIYKWLESRDPAG